jgi:hypothetical protein
MNVINEGLFGAEKSGKSKGDNARAQALTAQQ